MGLLTMDILSILLEQASPKVSLFFTGTLCLTSTNEEYSGIGHLHLVRNGNIAMYEDGESMQLLSGPSLVVLPKGTKHCLRPLSLSGCDVMCAKLIMQDSPLYRALPSSIIIPLDGTITLKSAVDFLFNEAFSEKRYGQTAVISSTLDLVLLLLMRHLVEKEMCKASFLSAISDIKLAKAIEVIHKNPEYPWTVELLAKNVGMSRSRFAAMFHNLIGLPPASYLSETRLLLAQKLLLSGKPIKSVCIDVGYSGTVAFTRAFQQKFYITPKKWLEKKLDSKK